MDTENGKISKLQSPLEKIKLDGFNYIAIEGNIGAGKLLWLVKLPKILMLKRF
jgi:hypothetical protein